MRRPVSLAVSALLLLASVQASAQSDDAIPDAKAAPEVVIALGGPARGDTDINASGAMGLKYHGGRLVIHADQPGTYEVSLDLRDPDHPGMAISRAES